MNKKVIVVGGAGFVGSNLSKELVNKDFEVHIIDNFSGGKRENVPEKAIVHELDIRDRAAVKEAFHSVGDIYCVFHLAALPRVQFSIENPLDTTDVNVVGTVNILVASEKTKARRLVYSASSSAYGDQPVMPLVETMPASPKSPYGLQKYAGELFVKMWSEIYGLPTVSLRYFNVYGPGLDPNGAYALVIGRFLKQLKEGQTLTITGDGTQTRDFTHVNDVVAANILAMESGNVGKGEVINIGAGNNISINDLAKMMGGKIEYLPPRMEPHDTKADNRKAAELLGWEPQVKLEDGIEELKQIFGLK